MKKVAVIHTFLYSVEDLKALFKKYAPEVEMINIIDDSLLSEALANQGVTPGIRRRMTRYMLAAQDAGADLILNQCSSVGEVARYVAQQLEIPVALVDEPMARKAVQLGSRVSVIATAISTVGPSSRLVERAAVEAGKDVAVKGVYVEGAYDALLKAGDRDLHDALIKEAVKRAEMDSDVIVLAQGSMYRLVRMLEEAVHIPVLTSFETGVQQIRDILKLDV